MTKIEDLAEYISTCVISYKIPSEEMVMEFVKGLEKISADIIPINPSIVMLYSDCLNTDGAQAYLTLRHRSEYFMFLTYYIRKVIENLINPKIKREDIFEDFWRFFFHTSLKDPYYYPDEYENFDDKENIFED